MKPHLLQNALINLLKPLSFIIVISIEFYLAFKDRLLFIILFSLPSSRSCFVLLFFFFTIIIWIIIKHFIYSNSSYLPIYLLDFSCLKPPKSFRVPLACLIEHATLTQQFSQDSILFMEQLIRSSGQGEETYLPPHIFYLPPRTTHQDAINEAQMVAFPVIDDLLFKTETSAREIDVLVVNCSSYSPSPSLSSNIINKYNMKSDIKSFNLSGMGCSAGAIGIDIAQNLLKVHKNYNALVVSLEILCNNWYYGNDKPKLILNSSFRMGCSAVLLTNRTEAKNTSKYKLLQLVRTQRAFDDKCYFSAMREEDSRGINGFNINRNAIEAFSNTLRSNVKALGSRILPFREKIRYGLSVLRKKFHFLSSTRDNNNNNNNNVHHVPDFMTVVQHVCIPTSGKSVVMEIGKGLKLSEREMEATLMTLNRFGNLSASSLWYVLAYMEAKERVKKGDKVWQIGIGSGYKCNSVVWECLRPIINESTKGPWSDCIDRYPVVTD